MEIWDRIRLTAQGVRLIAILDRADTDTAAREVGEGGEGGGQRRERCESEEVQCHVAGGIRFRMAAQQPGQRGEFPSRRNTRASVAQAAFRVTTRTMEWRELNIGDNYCQGDATARIVALEL